jgi:hypothetical protein
MRRIEITSEFSARFSKTEKSTISNELSITDVFLQNSQPRILPINSFLSIYDNIFV